MAIPAYSSLGIKDQPLVESWSKPIAHRQPVSTDMEGGNVRMRAQPGDGMFELQFDILYTNAEAATFRAWEATTLGYGTSRFTMNVWTGSAMEVRTVQFIEPYKELPQPPSYVQVSFHLRVYP